MADSSERASAQPIPYRPAAETGAAQRPVASGHAPFDNSPRMTAQRRVIEQWRRAHAATAESRNGIGKSAQPLEGSLQNTAQRQKVDPAEESDKTVEEIVALMEPRAEGAAADMLWDFKELEEDCRYYVATNEAAGDAERFGLMSLKAPPDVQDGEPGGVDPRIDGSLWVEGLVADPGAGLGALLLAKAEEIARAEHKLAIAMAAYEYDPADRGETGAPYSVAGYYGDRLGYTYTGEAYEEVDEDNQQSHFYPIYSKPIAQLQEITGASADQVSKVADRAATLGSQVAQRQIASGIAQLRSGAVAQRQYAWSVHGVDGVLIDPEKPQVIKLGGYDDMTIPLATLAVRFGFDAAGARLVREGDGEWELVERAVEEGGGWNRANTAAPKQQALIMGRLKGKALHETVADLNAKDPKSLSEAESLKIERLCRDLGRMLVLDLVARNNDRFNLTRFDDELLTTDAEKILDADEWRRWMANEGNVMVDVDTGGATPIDSLFTTTDDEDRYARNVASLLANRKDELTDSGLLIVGDHNWSGTPCAKKAFRAGIDQGIQCLLAL